MRKQSLPLLVVIAFLFSTLLGIPATASGAKPRIEGQCGNLLKLQDDKGPFLYFNPVIKVTYYGAPLKITAYYSTKKGEPRSEQGKKITTVEGKASSSRKFSGYFDFSYEFLRYGQKSNGFFQMDLEVTDSRKRKAGLKCIFNGDYGFPRATPTPISIPSPRPSFSAQPNPSASPSPTPTTTGPANELVGMVFHQSSSGVIDLGLLLRSNSTKKLFFTLSGIGKRTAIKSSFTVQDFWQDKVLGCATFSECFTGSYLLEWGSESAVPINFDNLPHPDGFLTRPSVAEMEFGRDSNEAIALTNYLLAYEGVRSLVYRIDLKSGVKTPIFASYCQALNYQGCTTGSIVRDLKVNQNTGDIFLIVEFGNKLRSGTNSYSLVKLPGNTPSITPAKAKDVIGKRIWEGNTSALYVESDPTKQISRAITSPDGSTVFFKRSRVDNSARENEICRISNGGVVCKMVAPFSGLGLIQALDATKVVISTGQSNVFLYDFETGAQETVSNIPIDGSFLDFDN